VLFVDWWLPTYSHFDFQNPFSRQTWISRVTISFHCLLLLQENPNQCGWTAQVVFTGLMSFLSLGPFHRAIAVPSVTRCRCCCGHRCAAGVRQWRHVTVATPGEWQCKTGGVRRLAVANGPNIFQMLLVEQYHWKKQSTDYSSLPGYISYSFATRLTLFISALYRLFACLCTPFFLLIFSFLIYFHIFFENRLAPFPSWRSQKVTRPGF